ncbi:MAG: porin family protein [Bacteroidota bacterium]
MKTILLLLALLSSALLSAQTKLGLKLSPVVASNRVTNDAQDVENDGSRLNLSVGLVVDKPLSDSYYFSTGLIYMPKRAAFRVSADSAESYTLQYLQIPITLKLFTSEIAPDVKVYFQIGSALELKVFEEPKEPSFDTITKFNLLDFSVILGSGIEYQAGTNTTIFAGISYQRGLSNTINETVSNADDLQLRNTIVSLDLGVKF